MAGAVAFCDGDLSLEAERIVMEPGCGSATHFFRMVHAASREELGSIDLRVSTDTYVRLYAGQVGFEVRPAYRGSRYAARAVTLLLPLARRLGMQELWITCGPENQASRRTCELAGARLVEIVDVPADSVLFRNGHARRCRYRLEL